MLEEEEVLGQTSWVFERSEGWSEMWMQEEDLGIVSICKANMRNRQSEPWVSFFGRVDFRLLEEATGASGGLDGSS